jgi:hypothetical protein
VAGAVEPLLDTRAMSSVMVGVEAEEAFKGVAALRCPVIFGEAAEATTLCSLPEELSHLRWFTGRTPRLWLRQLLAPLPSLDNLPFLVWSSSGTLLKLRRRLSRSIHGSGGWPALLSMKVRGGPSRIRHHEHKTQPGPVSRCRPRTGWWQLFLGGTRHGHRALR